MNSLTINHLFVEVTGKKIINNLDLVIKSGEIHVLMGPNGSGKTSLILGIGGHPDYKISSGKILLNNQDITYLPPNQKSKMGLQLSFQNPVVLNGITIEKLLRQAYKNLYPEKNFNFLEFHKNIQKKAKELNINPLLLKRSLNDDFSGGEKKLMEMLTLLILQPKFIFFDEIDTGLDLDNLKLVAKNIIKLKSQKSGILLVTHNQRLLNYLPIKSLHIIRSGKIIKSGNISLINQIENFSYAKI